MGFIDIRYIYCCCCFLVRVVEQENIRFSPSEEFLRGGKVWIISICTDGFCFKFGWLLQYLDGVCLHKGSLIWP